MFIADYKNGLPALDVASGEIRAVLARRNAERFKGLNDLTFALNGDLYFTDQGQTGLHDPTGRVYRLRGNGQLDCLVGNGPSPNGLVLHPSENVLFVAMTRDNSVWRLPLLPDGSTAKVGRFAQFYGISGPDGMAMDERGNLVVAHASLSAAIVLSPDGEPIARIASFAAAPSPTWRSEARIASASTSRNRRPGPSSKPTGPCRDECSTARSPAETRANG